MLQQLTMRDFNIILALCINIGFSVSRRVTSPCHGVENGLCGRGQHVLFTEDSKFTCADCPLGTYLDFASHSCEACKSHSHPHVKEVLIEQGSTTRDNVIFCKEGFFRRRSHSARRRSLGCEKCSVCKEGTWEAQACSENEDTLCCQSGMVAGRKDGRATCVLPHHRVLRHGVLLRKERSSGSNVTDDNRKRANSSPQGGPHHQDPSHGYSRADYETEFRQDKVEFPIWARILCAGVAIGVFLFYLGVGIPCNACGSKDKLRALRNWAFSRNVEPATDVESKEKTPVKPNSSSDPV